MSWGQFARRTEMGLGLWRGELEKHKEEIQILTNEMIKEMKEEDEKAKETSAEQKTEPEENQKEDEKLVTCTDKNANETLDTRDAL